MQSSGLLLLLIVAQAATPGTLIRVNSRNQGRSFIVDTTLPAIRKELIDVAAPLPAGPIPEWFTPYAGAAAMSRPSPNAPPDFGFQDYSSAAAPDAVFTYYEAALRAAGVNISSVFRQPGRGGGMHFDDGPRTGIVSVTVGVREPTNFSITWRPKVIKPVPLQPNSVLESVWFDDDRGVLRLRDRATGREYNLSTASMLNTARSTPLEPAARADFPPWLAFYPGAKVEMAAGPPAGWKPEKTTDMRSFRIELDTAATVVQVRDFYRQLIASNGMTMKWERDSGTSYAFEARSRDGMHQFYLDINRGVNTHISLMDHYTLPR